MAHKNAEERKIANLGSMDLLFGRNYSTSITVLCECYSFNEVMYVEPIPS